MSNSNPLARRVDKMLDQVLTDEQRIPDWQIGQMASEDAHELIMRKLAILTDETLTDEQKELAYRAVDSEIHGKRTDAEHAAMDAYFKRHAGDYAGAKERLLQMLGLQQEAMCHE